MTPADVALMAKIRASYGSAISEACTTTPVTVAFLAALIANESGGNRDAKRFEPAVLISLWNVLQGRATAFGKYTGANLLAFIQSPASGVTSSATQAMVRLDSLATSWGLTQIMGYNVLPLEPQNLAIPAIALRNTAALLEDFCKRFQLDPAKDFAKLFTCWNAGHPDGVTADPNYVSNGLARLAIYAGGAQ